MRALAPSGISGCDNKRESIHPTALVYLTWADQGGYSWMSALEARSSRGSGEAVEKIEEFIKLKRFFEHGLHKLFLQDGRTDEANIAGC
jgi:hypothetical protein